MSFERVYRDVQGTSSTDLAFRIEEAIKHLEARNDVKHVWPVSVSHDIRDGGLGLLWTAFIVCEIELTDDP